MDLVPWSSGVMKRGDIYGRYKVIGIYQERDAYPQYAHVQCKCGSAPRFVRLNVLRSGQSQSCGCLHKERVTTHGQWGKPLFTVWSRMMSRCYNEKDKCFPRYGGRGIQVCKKWHNINAFIKDMSPSFLTGLTIDRKNNDGDYKPSNCRWATTKQQTRNYSRNIFLEYNDETLCIADWALKLEICYGTLWDRLKQGWSTERALTTPVNS